MADIQQDYKTHRKIVPLYHIGILGILAVNLVWSIVQLVRGPGFENALGLAVALALIGLALYARLFPLRAQDRIIRLEMRLRLAELLPEELRSRIPELNHHQLIGLRFAGDAELPDLVRRVLEEKMADREAIKRAVKDWRADQLRV